MFCTFLFTIPSLNSAFYYTIFICTYSKQHRWRVSEQRTLGEQISSRTRMAEVFLNSLEGSGWSVVPTTRTITYVSGNDESAIDYWLSSSQVEISELQVGGTLAAQHRPVSMLASFPALDGQLLSLDGIISPAKTKKKNFLKIKKLFLIIKNSF